MLKGKSEYHRPEDPVALAPFSLERISLPDSLVGLPDAVDLLPDDARQYLEGGEHMLRDDVALDAPKPYWDPLLAKNQKITASSSRSLTASVFFSTLEPRKTKWGCSLCTKATESASDSLSMQGPLM